MLGFRSRKLLIDWERERPVFDSDDDGMEGDGGDRLEVVAGKQEGD